MEGGGLLVGAGTVNGVAVMGTPDAPELPYVRLQRQGREVRILEHGIADSLDALHKALGTRVPLAVVLHTPRAVHRVMQVTGEDMEMALRRTFPNAPLEQLHVSAWREGKGAGASIMRREHAAPFLDGLRQRGFRCVQFDVGPWGLLNVRRMAAEDGGTWKCQGQTFTFEGPDLLSHALEAGPGSDITLGAEIIPATHALAFAAAWESLLPSLSRYGALDLAVVTDRSEEKARIWYERLLLGSLFVLLALLGSERLLHEKVSREQATLQVNAAEQAKVRNDLSNLRSEVEAREGLVQQLGLGKERRIADRTGRILRTVPKEVLLDRLSIDPLTGPLRERDRVNTTLGLVRLEGTCTDAVVLNDWMEQLRLTAAIQQVRLVSFATEATGQRPTFIIEITG